MKTSFVVYLVLCCAIGSLIGVFVANGYMKVNKPKTTQGSAKKEEDPIYRFYQHPVSGDQILYSPIKRDYFHTVDSAQWVFWVEDSVGHIKTVFIPTNF